MKKKVALYSDSDIYNAFNESIFQYGINRSHVIEKLMDKFNKEQEDDKRLPELARKYASKRNNEAPNIKYSASIDENIYKSYRGNVKIYHPSVVLMMLMQEYTDLPEEEKVKILFGE